VYNRGPETYIGHDIIKVDARDKVRGKALYPDDIKFEDCLYLKVKRATYPHAILKKLDVSKAEKLTGVVSIITAADIPHVKNFGLIIKDQPVLIGIGEKMRYMGDALAIVIAESKEIARRALDLIRVEVAKLEIIDNPLRAMEDDTPKIHKDGNIISNYILKKGDIKKGFEEADIIVENEYRTQHIEQLPLQAEAGLAYYDPEEDEIKIWVASQWLHDTQADIAQSLGVPKEKIRLIQAAIGGAFGKKEDISVHIHLALAALKTKRPVKLTYTREESMITQSKRHPIIIRLKTGVNRQGILTAVKAELIGDTGAYASSGPAVVHKGLFHCTGPYNVENVEGVSYTVYTNNTYAGAMRGFGAMQMAFAYESQMDILAHKLGIDPFDFRRKNAYEIGSKTPNGQILSHSVNVKETINTAERMINGRGY
jgi:nicotinate dehydrogenase large molybdopterin subunit